MFRTVGIPLPPDGALPPEEPLRRALADGLLLVAEVEDGRTAGFVAAAPLDAALHVFTIAVDPAHMRRGLGRALMTAALEHAAWAFWPAVTLTTFRDVPWNAPFYRSLGFLAADDALLAPGLAGVRARERAIGLDALGPRLAMARLL
nr:GNAT family N-acetyltransferase [Methylopila capsulata]